MTAGLALLNRVALCLKLATIHDLSNAALVQPVAQLIATVNIDYTAASGQKRSKRAELLAGSSNSLSTSASLGKRTSTPRGCADSRRVWPLSMARPRAGSRSPAR